MLNLIRILGHKTIKIMIRLGQLTLLLVNILLQLKNNFCRFDLIIKQIYFFGVSSIGIISFCGLFIGLVLGLQGYNSLIQFNAESSLGAVVAISILREIGPVLAAILFASSTASAMTSEIGLMKATDQIGALEVMAVNPIERIIGPRFWAGVIAMPLLTIICNASAILGTYVMAVQYYGLDANVFWEQMQSHISFSYDVLNGLFKALCFGFIVMLIAVYQGLYCFPTPSGILKATNRTVVWCSISILATDFILTVFLFTG